MDLDPAPDRDPPPDLDPAPALDAGLAALRPLGGFFVLRAAVRPPRPLPTLADAYADRAADGPDPLAARVRRVAAGIGAPEERVAASVAHLGLAARLAAAALGCAALHGAVPDLGPGLLRWDPEATAPDDLWLTDVRPRPAERLGEVLLDGHLLPLARVLAARHRLAPGLLRGNAASAVAGAARQLDRWARERGRPDVARRTATTVERLFTHPYLSGTGSFTGTAFRRRSCCLYYRVPAGGVCGDCCFTRPPRSSPRAPSG
ncbi:(2Fe-2S)-binding protein [Streptomyces longwoodensis]|uniref:(2Fe-2S)-binding protein n=1 Tax=Streptomyces longwoodensis TaxID=68231 RepID=UPI0033EED30E